MAPTIRTSRLRRRRRRDPGRPGFGAAAGLGFAPAGGRARAAWPDRPVRRAVEQARAGGVVGGTPERYAASIRGRTGRRVPVIRSAGIGAE